MALYYYRIHHLVVASSLYFPELTPTAPQPEMVLIEEANVPDALPDEGKLEQGELWEGELRYQRSNGVILMHFNDIGRVLMTADNVIQVAKDPSSDGETLRLYLLGSCLGFWMLSRGIFPFHGSTVHTPLGTAMFVGESGMGKSTTAARFLREGHPVLTDDVCVVRFDDNNIPYAYASSRRIKLWDDSLEQLGFSREEAKLVLPDWTKRQLINTSRPHPAPQPLTIVYQLWPHEASTLDLRSLRSTEKMVVLAGNTFREEGIAIFGRQHEHFAFCSRLAQQVPVKRLYRPTGRFALDELYQLVMADLAQLTPQPAETSSGTSALPRPESA